MKTYQFSSIKELNNFYGTDEYETATQIVLSGSSSQDLSKAIYEFEKLRSNMVVSTVGTTGGILAAAAAMAAGIAAAPIVITGAVVAVAAYEVNRWNWKRKDDEFERVFPWGEFAQKITHDGWKIKKNSGEIIILQKTQ